MRARNGAGTGSVMDFALSVSVAVTSSLVTVGRMTCVDPVAGGVAAPGPRVDDGVVIAVGRIRTRRVHRRTGR